MKRQDLTAINKRLGAQMDKRMSKFVRNKDHVSDGKLFETGIVVMLQTFMENIVPNDGKKKPVLVNDPVDDFLYGTDLVINDPQNVFPGIPGITRIDVTTNMTGKDNMPLMTPSFGMKKFYPDRPTMFSKSLSPTQRGSIELKGTDGWHLRFGLRIGNNNHGFDEPVVVIGLENHADFDKRQPIEMTVEQLQNNIAENAPEIIRMAKLTLASYQYATDPKKQAELDAQVRGGRSAKNLLPILVPNSKYFNEEQPYVTGSMQKERMCRATVVDDDGTIIKDHEGRPKSIETNMPWISRAGQAVIRAALHSPYMRDENKPVARGLLNRAARKPHQTAPVVAYKNGEPVKNKDLRTSAVKRLARVMHSQFKKQDEAEHDYTSPDKK